MQVTYKKGLMGVELLFIAAVGWRVWAWWQIRDVPMTGQSMVLAQPVKKTSFACLVAYRGETILVSQHVCDTSGLSTAQPGDEITVYGKASVLVKKHDFQPWSYWWWVRQMGRLHARCTQLLREQLPEPAASLVAGVVLGEQADMPAALTAALRQTGTAHIVSASGYNVTVVMSVALAVGVRWLGRKRGLAMATLLVWGYVLLAGATPPVVRAGLMGFVMVLGMEWGREYWSGWSLILVSGAMLFAEPWLIMNLSWQLSTAATAGVIWGTGLFDIPELIPNIHHHSIWNEIVTSVIESFSLTLAATIMTAPLLLLAFGSTSWLGLFVNPLVLWLVPPLMYLGGTMILSGIILPYIGSLFAWAITPLAWLLLSLINLGARLSGGTIQIQMNWWIVVGWWLMWLGWWGMRRRL